jgi:hypothetical protein
MGQGRLVSDFGYVTVSDCKPRQRPGVIGEIAQSFHFNGNHIDRVIGAAKSWCHGNGLGFVLEYFPSGSASDCWRACIGKHGEAHGDLASAALLSACLAAHRKLAVVGIMHGLLERSKK